MQHPDAPPAGQNFFKTTAGVVFITVITSVMTVWLLMLYLFPSSFRPVELSQKEQVKLERKINFLKLDLNVVPAPSARKKPDVVPLTPERYSEENARREVEFSEREINALIATNTDLASKLAIDLSPHLVSARLLIPLDPDMPIMGGKTLKISAGVEMRYQRDRPVVVLKGVSLWGVPLPNAWLGNLKDIDLIHEFGEEGFWKAFAAGIEDISVGDEVLILKLKK